MIVYARIADLQSKTTMMCKWFLRCFWTCREVSLIDEIESPFLLGMFVGTVDGRNPKQPPGM